jgi:lipopolysaccharide export system permease protein
VFGSILSRSIFLELIRIFTLCLIGITGILVMAGIIPEASQQGLTPVQALAAIPLLVPTMMPFAIPATTLFATCVVYGRLSHDNEILALKSAGVNILRVVWPALFLGLAMSAVTMGLYYKLIPSTYYMMRAQALNDIEEFLYARLKKDHCIKGDRKMPFSLWVSHVQGQWLQEPLFERMDGKGHYDVTVRAREGRLKVDLEKRQIHVIMRFGTVLKADGTRLNFLQDQWDLDLPEDYGQDLKLRPRAMTCPEIVERRQEIKAEEDRLAAEIAFQISLSVLKGATQSLPAHIANLTAEKKRRQIEVTSLDAELLMRPALSLGCFCFVLVGCPVGIWFGRSDYLSAFITSFLPNVFIYYPLYLCGTNLAKQGKMPLIAGIWAANSVMALIGVALFKRLMRN